MSVNEKRPMKVSFDARKVRKGLLILVINIMPILVVLGVGEFYLQYKGRKPYLRTFPGQYQGVGDRIWAQQDPSLGWTVNPDWLPQEINPQGFRDTKTFANLPAKSDKTRVMVLGDSFMFGVGLEADEALPGLLQADLPNNYEVYSLGVPGWGIDQMYLAYQDYKAVIEPDIVILAFIDDDVMRVLEAYRIRERLNKPSFTVAKGQLVLRTPASKATLYFNEIIGKSVFLSYILREVYAVTEAKPVINYVFADIDQDIRSRGGRLVVIRIPTPKQDEAIQVLRRRLINYDKMLESTEATYLELTQELTQHPNWETELHFPDDHPSPDHLNKPGNRILADYVLKYVFEN